MKIHYVVLRNFRGVSERRTDFADAGITVVEGANELGKTSIVEAIDLLLEEPDTSQKRPVRAVQPIGVDAGAEVEAEFSTGRYRFVYRKRWHKRAETTLMIREPAPEQLVGRPAHDRVRSILNESLDQDLWAALRVEQKKPIDQAALGGNDALARALDAASGGARETGRESNLYERVEGEYLADFTRTGKATGAYRAAISAYEKARADAETASEAVREVERDVERHAELGRELRTLATRQVRHEGELAALEERWQALAEQRRKVDELRDQAERAKREADAAQTAYRERQELVAAVDTSDGNLTGLLREAEQAEPRLSAADRLFREAETALTAARRVASEADRAAQRSSEDLAYLHDKAALDELSDRQKRATEAMQRIAEAERLLATCTVDDELLAELEAAYLDVTRTQAALQAGAPNVIVEALAPTDVYIDGNHLSLAPGLDEHRAVTEPVEVLLPNLLRVRITPGASEEGLHNAALKAEEKYRDLCIRARVADMAAARESHQRQRDAQQIRVSSEEALHQALGGRLLEELAQAVAGLSARVTEAERLRATDVPLPEDLATAQAAEQSAREAAADARQRAERAEENYDERREAISKLREDDLVRGTKVEGARRELDGAQARLNEARAVASDDAVADSLSHADRMAAAATEELRQHESDLATHDLDSFEANLDNTRNLQRRLVEEQENRQYELTRLAGRLELAGSEGRQDRLDAALAALEDAERRHRSIDARAKAARLLYETMRRHREEAKRAYVAPFREQVERLGRIVFGRTLRLDVDGDLRIVSRTLDGVTVPYDDLSMGAREQLCIVARLACATLIDPNEGVPVIIDDALGHSDPRRLDRIGAVFGAVVNKSQVIVLTCTPERYRGIGSAKVVRLEEAPAQARTGTSVAITPAPITPENPAPEPDPDGNPAETILACLREAGRAIGKADVLDRTGLSPELWAPTINTLLDNRKVYRMGERRGATYLPIETS